MKRKPVSSALSESAGCTKAERYLGFTTVVSKCAFDGYSFCCSNHFCVVMLAVSVISVKAEIYFDVNKRTLFLM